MVRYDGPGPENWISGSDRRTGDFRPWSRMWNYCFKILNFVADPKVRLIFGILEVSYFAGFGTFQSIKNDVEEFTLISLVVRVPLKRITNLQIFPIHVEKSKT